MEVFDSSPSGTGKKHAKHRNRREAVVQAVLEVREESFFGPTRQGGHVRLLPGGDVDEGFGQPAQERAEGETLAVRKPNADRIGYQAGLVAVADRLDFGLPAAPRLTRGRRRPPPLPTAP